MTNEINKLWLLDLSQRLSQIQTEIRKAGDTDLLTLDYLLGRTSLEAGLCSELKSEDIKGKHHDQ